MRKTRDDLSWRTLALCIALGLLLGAVPASVMEALQPVTPAQDPAVLTAFAMPMLAGGMLGLLAWFIADTLRYRARDRHDG